MPKDALVAMLDATSDRVFEFFEKCPPWGSGKDTLGNKSVAGVRQSSMLRAKVSEILESVERYEMKESPLRGRGARSGSGALPPSAPSAPSRGGGRGGGRGLPPLQIDGRGGQYTEGALGLAAAPAAKPKPRLSLKRGLEEAALEEIQELKKLVTDLKMQKQQAAPAAPSEPAAPRPPAAPLAEQLTLGGTAQGEAPKTIADRLMQAEVCEHACVLVCLCAC